MLYELRAYRSSSLVHARKGERVIHGTHVGCFCMSLPDRLFMRYKLQYIHIISSPLAYVCIQYGRIQFHQSRQATWAPQMCPSGSRSVGKKSQVGAPHHHCDFSARAYSPCTTPCHHRTRVHQPGVPSSIIMSRQLLVSIDQKNNQNLHIRRTLRGSSPRRRNPTERSPPILRPSRGLSIAHHFRTQFEIRKA
jgi:hypothetical protein